MNFLKKDSDCPLTIFTKLGKINCFRWLSAEGFPSGQRGQTVNLLAQPSEVRILPPPPAVAGGLPGKRPDRLPGSRRGTRRRWWMGTDGASRRCGCSSTARTSAFQADDVGSIPITRSSLRTCSGRVAAHIAQSVEHFLGKEEVTGSSPVVGSSRPKCWAGQ